MSARAFRPGGAGAALTIKVTARAPRTEVKGVMEDGTLKIAVAAPPEDGKANAALIAFLARELGVRQDQVEIVAGHHAAHKLISILGLSSQEVEARLIRAD